MKRSVSSQNIEGVIVAPSSKSVAQRAIVAALLAEGSCLLRGVTPCADTRYALQLVQACGKSCTWEGADCRISGAVDWRFHLPESLVCGESALLTRMIAPIMALSPCRVELHGIGSLLRRPVRIVESPLYQLGVEVSSHAGYLPLTIRGPIHGGLVEVDGSVSSQLLSGLLMALPLADEDSEIRVEGLVSKPYVDMTLTMLSYWGIQIVREDYRRFYVAGRQHYVPFEMDIEKDWSAVSCLFVAGCFAGEVRIPGLNLKSKQADIAMLAALKASGAACRIIQTSGDSCTVIVSASVLSAFVFDATDCPDLFPALVALASGAAGTTCLKGVHRLLHKESNRAMVLQEEFGKLGIGVRIDCDCMFITGGEIHGGEVFSHGDHRIAMALAVAALRSKEIVTIVGAEAVDKSYPSFWEDLGF